MTVQLLLEDGQEIKRAAFARGSRESRKREKQSVSFHACQRLTFELNRADTGVLRRIDEAIFTDRVGGIARAGSAIHKS
jgi:hypothetical protein